MARKQGIYPAPIYESVLSNGETVRLSFHSPKGKPIDFAAGRKSAEAILLTDYDPERITWIRGDDGAWRGRWGRRELQIIRGYVEHPDIGRVEDTPANRQPSPTLRPNWRGMVEAARAALQRGDTVAAIAALGGEVPAVSRIAA